LLQLSQDLFRAQGREIGVDVSAFREAEKGSEVAGRLREECLLGQLHAIKASFTEASEHGGRRTGDAERQQPQG
jgi:hypothetical protein